MWGDNSISYGGRDNTIQKWTNETVKRYHAVQFLLHKFQVFYGYTKDIIVHGTCNESL